MRDVKEYGHTGYGGWLLCVVVAVLAVLFITPSLARQGLVPVLAFLIVMLPLLGWALRLAIQTGTVRLRLTADGYFERRGTFLPTLRIPMSRIRYLERAIVGDDPMLTIHYNHRESIDWRANEADLSDIVARIEAANPSVTVIGSTPRES
jgi:hypothetical protein